MFLRLQCVGTEGTQLVAIHVGEAAVAAALHEGLPLGGGGEFQQRLAYGMRLGVTQARVGEIHQARQGRGLGEHAQLLAQLGGRQLVGVQPSMAASARPLMTCITALVWVPESDASGNRCCA